MDRLAPSILSADFADLASAVAKIRPAADLLHVDVMDGHFVPNLTIGPPVVKSLRRHTDLYLDCHLMIENPGAYLPAFREAGANGCSVHLEAGDTAAHIKLMRELDLDCGLAVNPDTEYEQYEEYLSDIDMLVVMSVYPGFGGQSFISDVMAKMLRTREELSRRGLNVSIEIDGGINEETAKVAAINGADTFVAGNAIFAQADPLAAAQRIREAISAIRRVRS